MGRVKLEPGIAEPRPGYFVFHFRDPATGRWTSRAVGKDRETANRNRRAILDQLEKVGHYDRRNPTIAELWEAFQAARGDLSPSTLSDYRSCWGYVSEIRDLRLAEVDTQRLRALMASLDHVQVPDGKDDKGNPKTKPLSEKRKQNILMFVKSLFSFAEKERWIPLSPARGLRTKRTVKATIKVPRRAQLDRVMAEVPEHYRHLVHTMLYTGIRLGEAVALEWSEDWKPHGEVPQIHISKTCSRGIIRPPKSEDGNRDIPLPDRVRDDLRAWHKECRKKWPDGDYMFPNTQGGRLCPDNFRARVWRPACERAKVPHLRIHDLRHTYITWLVETGQHPLVIKTVAGHADLKTTQRYFDMRDAAHRQIIDAFK
jgi:integrase